MGYKYIYYCLVFTLSVLTSVVACSPTRFQPAVAPDSVCDASVISCVVQNGITELEVAFRVGAGKVDILIVNDNTASMSPIQQKILSRFSGFIQNLDSNEINYKIGMTITDAASFTAKPLLDLGSGLDSIQSTDANRLSAFNSALTSLQRSTIICEDFIKSSYYTYGDNFRNTADYKNNYSKYCASGDERGIYAAYQVVNTRTDFFRSDAHLNIILVSNEDERSGDYNSNSNFALADQDRPQGLVDLITQKLPNKYWEFNSIITKTSACAVEQEEAFVDRNGQPIKVNGNYVVGANVGVQYAALSSLASVDVDGNATTRGQVYDICENDYARHFQSIANKISDSARSLTLKCIPLEIPIVTVANQPGVTVPFDWTPGSTEVVFKKGSERTDLRVKIRCNVGGVQ